LEEIEMEEVKDISLEDFEEKLMEIPEVQEDSHLFNALRVLWETGCRIPELLNITFGDMWVIDEEMALLFVIDPKSGQHRVLPLRETAPYLFHQTEMVREHPTLLNMKMFNFPEMTVNKVLKQIGLTAHDLRRLDALRLQKRSSPSWVIPYILGRKIDLSQRGVEIA